MIEIPHNALSEDALMGVIDAFVLREGTDYGHRDITLAEKRDRVLILLSSGRTRIVYYAENGHIDIEMLD